MPPALNPIHAQGDNLSGPVAMVLRPPNARPELLPEAGALAQAVGSQLHCLDTY
jgi:hypothetical protein